MLVQIRCEFVVDLIDLEVFPERRDADGIVSDIDDFEQRVVAIRFDLQRRLLDERFLLASLRRGIRVAFRCNHEQFQAERVDLCRRKGNSEFDFRIRRQDSLREVQGEVPIDHILIHFEFASARLQVSAPIAFFFYLIHRHAVRTCRPVIRKCCASCGLGRACADRFHISSIVDIMIAVC